MQTILGLIVMAGVPAYFVVQPATIWRWPGGWRVAALAPLLLTVPALVSACSRCTTDRTCGPSH